jgi:hypothetical protein
VVETYDTHSNEVRVRVRESWTTFAGLAAATNPSSSTIVTYTGVRILRYLPLWPSRLIRSVEDA